MSEPMSIEEVDKILEIGEEPSKTLSYIVMSIMLFFWASGIYVIYILVSATGKEVWKYLKTVADLLSETSVLMYISIAFILMIVAAFLYLFLVYKLGKELLMAFFALLGIGAIVLGGLMIYLLGEYSDAVYSGIIAIAIGLIVLILFMIFRRRIALAGRMIELSAKAVIDEKGILSIIIVKALIITWTTIAWILSLSYWSYDIYKLNPFGGSTILVIGVSVLIMFFMGLWVLTFLDAFFNAAIVRIVHDWYRSPEKDVASFGKGIKKAWGVSGAIAKYAFFFASLSFLIHLARSYARRGRGAGATAARIVTWVLGITEDLLKFFGFYMIPAMVIRKAGFKKALSDSVHKLRDLFVETLAGSFAFGFVIGFIAFLVASTFGIIGYFVGVYVFSSMVTIGLSKSTIGLVTAVAFFILGLIPVGLVSSAISVSWKTILYEYGLDIEFGMKGVFLPARLPPDVKEVFAQLLAEKGVTVPTPGPVVQQ